MEIDANSLTGTLDFNSRYASALHLRFHETSNFDIFFYIILIKFLGIPT